MQPALAGIHRIEAEANIKLRGSRCLRRRIPRQDISLAAIPSASLLVHRHRSTSRLRCHRALGRGRPHSRFSVCALPRSGPRPYFRPRATGNGLNISTCQRGLMVAHGEANHETQSRGLLSADSRLSGRSFRPTSLRSPRGQPPS